MARKRIDADAFDDDASPEEIADTLEILHESRPEKAQQIDEARDAQLTTDPETWAENPDEYDYPGVDSGPKFREENPGFELESFIDTFR